MGIGMLAREFERIGMILMDNDINIKLITHVGVLLGIEVVNYFVRSILLIGYSTYLRTFTTH